MKVNPARKPVNLSEKERDEIEDYCTLCGMTKAWLLFATALTEADSDFDKNKLRTIWDMVNKASSGSSMTAVRLMDLAEARFGVRLPYCHVYKAKIRTEKDMKQFENHVEANSISATLAIILILLTDNNMLSDLKARNMLLSARITQSIIESGRQTYKDIQDNLYNSKGILLFLNETNDTVELRTAA